MNGRRRIGAALTAVWLLALAATGARAGDGFPPEPLARGSSLDAEIVHLVVRGVLPIEALTFGPIDRGDLIRGLSAVARAGAAPAPVSAEVARRVLGERALSLRRTPRESLVVAPYARLMPVGEDGDWSWSAASRAGVRAVYDVDSTLAVVSDIFAAEIPEGRSFADPLIAGTDFILHTEEATISARLGPLRLRAGRDRHRWGPGESGTLLLSDDGEPFTFAEYQLRLGPNLRFLALNGFTDRHAAAPIDSSGAVPAGVNPERARSLAAHRLQWDVTPRLTIAIAEAARYQGGAHTLYLLGIIPYTLVERLDLQAGPADSTRHFARNNVLWSADVAWRVAPAALLYAEVLADDIATESADMPTRGGFQLGARWAPAWRGWGWTLGAEYTRISNYTYSVYYQDVCQCDWEHLGEPLGYGAGPDVEDMLLHAWAEPTPTWSAKAWLEATRKGAGAIGVPWQPASGSCACRAEAASGDEPGAWTLSGSVTRTTALGLAVQHRFWPRARLLSPAWVGASIEGRWTQPDDRAVARVRLMAGVGG